MKTGMKSYLDLVPISAKIHRKQNKMSIFCIVLAVALVTTIFGMADMFIRSQILQAQLEDGRWHIGVMHITDEEAAQISEFEGVESASCYGVLNFRGKKGYTLSGKNVIICGSDENYENMYLDFMAEGSFPRNRKETVITESARDMLGLQIGDSITINVPDGAELEYTISGFFHNVSKTMSEDSYAVFISTEAFREIYPVETESNSLDDYNSALFVRFEGTGNIRKAIDGLKSRFQLSEEQVAENAKILGLMGQSRDIFMMQIYATAAVLFVLVLLAGIMMIASSLNSSVSQRTEFFGLLRCVGATPKQVMRLVHREALGWCGFAIPLGVGFGIVVIWILCAVLRYLSPKYFYGLSVFGVSMPSVMAGIVVGILTVLLAARTPAKKAAGVSPLVAASGNASNAQPVKKAANTGFFKIDTALGIHHAKASRKNLILMAGSFALSIILFLSFYVTVGFMRHAIRPMRPWTADLSIISQDLTCSVDSEFLVSLKGNPAVRRAYGRMFAYSIPITSSDKSGRIDLISYEQNQFDWAKEYLVEGSLETAESNAGTGLIVYEPGNTVQVGDKVTLDIDGSLKKMEIVGMLSACPFTNDEDVGIIICSEDTFRQVTGQTDYTIIDVQLMNRATDREVNEIHRMVGSDFTFSDERMDNASARGTYYCFGLFIYGFLAVIAFITVFNVINSIAMSVTARMKLYGAFRAIGLSTRQLSKMVIAEAATYTIVGSIIGTVLGMLCNKFLFGMLVSYRWGDTWEIPFDALFIILFMVVLSLVLAVHGPTRRIRNMSIVDTISAE